ncbi:hypothetical protein [Bacteroides heparinolyticus]|uniref:hypothetical protein n=1 Tax=Prevotella heparinolytica TaxID=28113 RepID=UPI0035A005A8
MKPMVDNKVETISREITKSRIDEVVGDIYIIYTSAKIGFGEAIYDKGSYFKVVKNYYPSKSIETKGVAFNDGAPVGIWYYFDESGHLTKEENSDEGYDFSPDDVIAYCVKHKIKLPKGYHDSGFHTRVMKQELDGKKVWTIWHQVDGDKIEEIVLDGKIGRELNKRIIPFHNP